MVMSRVGVRMPNNAGRLAAGTTGGNDLLHTLALGRTAIIRKVMCYNNSGAAVNLQIGTLDRNPLGAAFVQLLPTLRSLNTFDNEWTEEDLPAVEFASDTTPTALGRTGDIYVLEATGGGVDVILEVEEFGS